MSYLDQWYDSSVDTTEPFDRSLFIDKQKQRLLELYILADKAGQIPRRMGGEATPEEMAQDKKFCRTLKQRCRMYIDLWTDGIFSVDEMLAQGVFDHDEIARYAKEVKWDEWLDAYGHTIRNYLAVVAAYYKTSQKKEKKIGNSLANMLVNEAVQFEKVYKTVFEK